MSLIMMKCLLAEGNVIAAAYEVPYLSQCTMEPLNCTLVVNDDKVETWVGHQGGSLVRDAINAVTGTAKENIKVNIAYLGGGFGRRAELDYVKKAAMVAKQMPGIPIQLVFTREEDMKNGMYRPAVASKFRAKLGADGMIEGWENKMALQSVGHSSMMRIMPAMAASPADDHQSTEGAVDLPYAMPNNKVAFGQMALEKLQVGNWRSVGASQNGFFAESFMDEMANSALAEGKYRGISLVKSFGSIVGQVAEISKTADKEISIDKVYCAIDCGRTVNPSIIEAQMQSGIIYGLTAACYGEITMDQGQIVQQNFPQYEMVRMNTAPTVAVHIMEVDEYPGGVGERSEFESYL